MDPRVAYFSMEIALDPALPTYAGGLGVLAGDVVPKKKPAPDIYELAVARLGADPKDTLVIEDSRNGLLSAVGAGLEAGQQVAARQDPRQRRVLGLHDLAQHRVPVARGGVGDQVPEQWWARDAEDDGWRAGRWDGWA